MKWREGRGTKNFDRRAFLDITQCLVRASDTDAGRNADSALLSDDAWQEASMAAKIIGTFPDCRRWPRNKVHFHGITISGNWHLQQHRDVLSSPPAALSYFRTGSMPGDRRRDAGRRYGPGDACGSQMCVLYGTLSLAYELVGATPGMAATDNKAKPSTAR